MEQTVMILVDTNILIEIYRSNKKIIDVIKEIGQENITVSDITCAELYFGARNKHELNSISKDLTKLTVIPINQEISETAVSLVKKFALSHKLSIPDPLIAATAIIHGLPLFTLNKKDFSYLPDLQLT